MMSALSFTAWGNGSDVKNRLTANHVGKQTDESILIFLIELTYLRFINGNKFCGF